MVYLFLADGAEEIEALTPVDILRRGGVDVTVVGINSDVIKGSHGISISTDITNDKIQNFDDIEGVILPGGMPGTLNLEADSVVISAVRHCYENNKLIAAICAAPSILGHLGILEGKEATAYPSFEEALKGAKISEKYVAHDGNIITARGMGVSVEFGLEILSALKGEKTAKAVEDSIQCAK